jgi:hypothetical protein
MTPSTKIAAILALTALSLGGCLSPQGNLAPDHGVSVSQNIAAQIADPDARYRRDLPPASSGARAAAASASSIGGGGGAGAGAAH